MALFYFGSGGRIRTHVLSESESDALPLGDTRIYNNAILALNYAEFNCFGYYCP